MVIPIHKQKRHTFGSLLLASRGKFTGTRVNMWTCTPLLRQCTDVCGEHLLVNHKVSNTPPATCRAYRLLHPWNLRSAYSLKLGVICCDWTEWAWIPWVEGWDSSQWVPTCSNTLVWNLRGVHRSLHSYVQLTRFCLVEAAVAQRNSPLPKGKAAICATRWAWKRAELGTWINMAEMDHSLNVRVLTTKNWDSTIKIIKIIQM